MRIIARTLCVLGAALIASQAAAEPENFTRLTPGVTYFNRPHADFAQHDAELRDCLVRASEVQPITGSLPNGLLTALLDADKNSVRLRTNAENCMVVKGWRVVRLEPSEGEALAALPRDQLAARLSSWVGAEAPHGQIVRAWRNGAADSDSILSGMPAGSGGVSLSLLTLTRDEALKSDMQSAMQNTPHNAFLQFPPASAFPRRLMPGTLNGISSDLAIVVFTASDSAPGRHAIWLNRDGTYDQAPTRRDAGVSYFGISEPPARVANVIARGPEGVTIAVAVPPGRWRVVGLGDRVTTFCLGAPFFDLKPGEVVYAGRFDLTSKDLRPEMTFEPEKIAPAESADVRQKLRPAKWMNGAASACTSGYITALEFRGFPYAQGYVLGGALKSR